MKKEKLQSVMCLAWQFVKKNGYNISDALKVAWANIKLKAKMQNSIVKFYFQKVDGSVREAFGTLSSKIVPETKGESKKDITTQVYYDTEKGAYRCFKMANLVL